MKYIQPLKLSGWGSWTFGTCSDTCGGGTRSDDRACLDYTGAEVNDDLCDGGAADATRIVDCETQNCPGE